MSTEAEDLIELRLENWARWKAMRGGLGGMGYGGSSWGDVGGSSGYREATIPTSDVEASETDAAIAKHVAPVDVRMTVYEYYLGKGGLADKARRLRCAVPTVYTRLKSAKEQLRQHFAEVRRLRLAERARVEALQAISPSEVLGLRRKS